MKINKFMVKTLLVVFLICGVVGVAYADSIKDAQDKKEELENELENTKDFLSTLEALKENEKEYVKALDAELEAIATEIYELTLSIEAKNIEIANTEKEINAAEADIEQQYEDMKLRIKYMYENGEVSDLQMIFDSQNMSDVLDRAEYINKITEYDRNMMIKLKESKEALVEKKAELDKERAELSILMVEAQNEQAKTELLVADKQATIDAYEGQIDAAETDAAALEKHIKEQEQLIAELEEIERQRQEANLEIMYDGGKMTWPLPGYTRLSDDYGIRNDPFGGPGQSMHNGIDIPAPAGTPIVAAYDGQVAWSYYNWSAGNWIGIDHGNGVYTVYMHMSKFVATEGQYVKKGDVIGLVGTTGSSTGNHLHFAVRLNGSYVNPHDYVTP